MKPLKAQLNRISLNYKEIEKYVELIRSKIVGEYVDRVFIPARNEYPKKFLKNEFCLRFSSKNADHLLFRVQPQQTYLAYFNGKKLKAQKDSSRSPFLLRISKTLKGVRLEDIRCIPNERIVILTFKNSIHLAIFLFPAHPEAYVFETTEPIEGKLNYSFSTAQDEEGEVTLPDGVNAPKDLKVQESLFESEEANFFSIQAFHRESAISERTVRIQKTLKESAKRVKKKLQSNQLTLQKIEKESDWFKMGEVLKSHLHELTDQSLKNKSHLVLRPYEEDQDIVIPIQAKLNLNQNVSYLFDRAKKNERRKIECTERLEESRKELKEILKNLDRSFETIEEIEEFELRIGIGHRVFDPKIEKRFKSFPGKRFLSQEGLSVFVGRNQKENQTLTFKYGKGNDIWMHVRGRPSSHALVSVPKGKSASLDTLLDAANLILHYSGGKEWGKTEVDYTFRKYVKKIKNSTDVSYSQNKTMSIDFDPKRLERLLSQN